MLKNITLHVVQNVERLIKLHECLVFLLKLLIHLKLW
jgi:hypothetical protein